MRNYRYIVFSVVLLLVGACRSTEEELLFEQTADERVEAAITGLEQSLTAPTNGWILRYRPVPESGSYVVLLNFDEQGNVRIQTDFGENDNEFYDQTITYRVDNSMGLELIFETYSFFSFLFEQGGATFEAEYELDYVNETPDGALVFRSKTDLTAITTLAFEPAPENAEGFLGRTVNTNLENLSESLGVISPVYRLNYANRDLSLFISLNTALRTLSFTSASTLSGERSQGVNFSTGYTVQGSSIVLDEPLVGNFLNNSVNIPAINFQDMTDASPIEVCDQPFNIQQYQGTIAESDDAIALQPTLSSPGGANFRNDFNLFRCPLGLIYDNGVSVGQQVVNDIEGVQQLQLYYANRAQNPFIAMGFLVVNESGSATFALKDFTTTNVGNQYQFDFAPEFTLYNDTTAVVDTLAMSTYLNRLTEGGQTRVIRTDSERYEFFNPCNGWSFVFFADTP
ncbi:DUF4302 domain-containing protein [Tunicatimonas pelagia]|uniref:DUF4302 domain-containing protein n=1 Tax=Tunicatimonas pelagia TaxID=931531 RepID=UPI0026650594|nr:DUF4302 domain-containing protein [Tunicatimonas pelagia]WKN44401.1 DUF4302 domain-containing protein [Tunicatimonas pelagia]